MSAGVVPESAANTLILYAYAQKGVHKAEVRIDSDQESEGRVPSVKYRVWLEPIAAVKWRAVKRAEKIESSLIRKATLLALARTGAPVSVIPEIKRLAEEYLPPKYTVEVEVVDE